MRSEKMRKIRIICLETDKSSVVAALHKLSIIDLRKSSLQLPDGLQSADAPTLSESLIRLNGAMQRLPHTQVSSERHLSGDALLKKLSASSKAISEVYSLTDEARNIRENQERLSYAHEVASAFSGSSVRFGNFESEIVEYRAFVTSHKQVREFEKGLSSAGVEREATICNQKKGVSAILIAYEKKAENSKVVEDLVKELKLKEVDLRAEYLEGTPAEILKRTNAAKAANDKRLNAVSSRLFEISRKHYSGLANLREMLEIELSRAEIGSNFKKTEETCIIEGWVPEKRLAQAKESISAASSGRYELEEIHSDELAPTYLNRPKILKPFDFLMNFYSTPRSDEIDPTWIFIISFPIFYGLMVSDVGYGLMSLIFVTWVASRTNPEGLVHNTAKIWQLTSISAIFFGVLSNQYLGVGLNQYLIPGFKGFDWFSNVTSLIVITILFGLFQVGAGFLLGFINNYSHGHKRHALSKLFSLSVLITGTIAVSGAFFSAFSPAVTLYATVLAIASLIGIVASNPSEATEITSLITHPLSYSRVMGFGLASVIIGFLIDKAFLPNLSMGIPLFIVYLLIFGILHFLNMILGIFEGAVQSARLNFVEFFTKFYSGGGTKYNPFSYKRLYTKE